MAEYGGKQRKQLSKVIGDSESKDVQLKRFIDNRPQAASQMKLINSIQKKHLLHEAWHVVQQKQGRVQPTMQMQGVNVNDNEGLEKEADVMGEKAVVQRIAANMLLKDFYQLKGMSNPHNVIQSVESVGTQQVGAVRNRIAALITLYVVNRNALNNIIEGANIVYRNQQAVNLAALDNDLRIRIGAANVLNGRGQNLIAGQSGVDGYKVLLKDVRSEYKRQRSYQKRLNIQITLPMPTIDVGVGDLVNANANEIVNQMNAWSGGADVLPGTFFVLPPFGGHPVDTRWEIRYPSIPGWASHDPHAAPNHIMANGSIPITAHGAPNLPAARNHLIAMMNLAGYI